MRPKQYGQGNSLMQIAAAVVGSAAAAQVVPREGAMTVTANPAIDARRQAAREAAQDKHGWVPDSAGLDAAIASATRVRITPEVVAAATHEIGTVAALTAALRALGFEVEEAAHGCDYGAHPCVCKGVELPHWEGMKGCTVKPDDGPICMPGRRLDHGHTVACGPMGGECTCPLGPEDAHFPDCPHYRDAEVKETAHKPSDVYGRVHFLLPYKWRMACGRKVGEHWSSALNIEAVNCPDCLATPEAQDAHNAVRGVSTPDCTCVPVPDSKTGEPLHAWSCALRDKGHGGVRRRLKSCVERWPGAEVEGDYDPRCCRFPKSCSASVYDDEQVTEADLEPER